MAFLNQYWVDPTVDGPDLLGTPNFDHWPTGTLDVVVAAPKSVSVYYAALLAEYRDDDAGAVLDAHELAVSEVLRHLNAEAAWAVVQEDEFTAAEYVQSSGLRAVQLLHNLAHDYPERPPHVHTHVLIERRVSTRETGEDQPLDLATLRRALPAAAALYSRALSSELMRRLPVRFAARPSSRVREIVDVPDEHIYAFAGTTCRPFATLRRYEVTPPPPAPPAPPMTFSELATG
jgi:hypothetical protein